MSLKHEVREESKNIERTETWSGDIGRFRVLFSQRDSFAELSIYPDDFKWMRLGILSCHPRSVADIEKFAEVSGDLLRQVAAELRAAGKEDLRSDWEKRRDEMDEHRERMITDAIAGRG